MSRETFVHVAYPMMLMDRDRQPRPYEVVPFPIRLDNMVGPVPKISGYVFSALQTNSAAHVPNTSMNLIMKTQTYVILIFMKHCFRIGVSLIR